MRFRDGTAFGKALFAGLILVYVAGVGVALSDKWQRVGEPDVGWVMDGRYVSPTRHDAAEAGIGGGGMAIRVNGVPVGRHFEPDIRHLLHTEIGATNTVTLERPGDRIEEVQVEVRRWRWGDVLWAEGPTALLGDLFFLVGVVSFLLRPYAATSWALLSLCCVVGGLLNTLFLGMRPGQVVGPLYFRSLVGFVGFVPLHAALAFPVVHPLLLRRPRVLWLVYGLGVIHAALQCAAWWTDWSGAFRLIGPLDMTLLLATLLIFLGRCALSARSSDALTAQRARILLAGALAGGVPFVLVNFLRNSFGLVVVETRYAYWSLSLFLLAIGYITVRYDFLNARVAVRRALIYAAAVLAVTEVTLVLLATEPYAAALLLLPLLYAWPHFDARLNAWLYPTRARLPELLRETGERMAACTSADDVLHVFADAPRRMADAERGVAFLFAGAAGSEEIVRFVGDQAANGRGPLGDEPLLRLMSTTGKEVFRDHIALEPQYSRIADRCYACFDRLGAEIVLPVHRGEDVIGGLAVGPRHGGEGYDQAELDALSTVGQQAVQSLIRIEATERLRQRELEFADLKRFFPPQIIDQVMARGGVRELRSQRKLVTVLFADLRGFTAFSDSVEPEEVTATLAEYHGAMGRCIAKFAGTLERFAGDGLMVFFNDPVEQPDHVERAVRMALAMRDDVRRLRERWTRKGYPIDVGIGIDSGFATCGFIGYEGRRDYAVIGNVTNLAARLSDAAGAGEILVSARVQAELGDGYRGESIGELSLKGFHQPQPTFRLLGATA